MLNAHGWSLAILHTLTYDSHCNWLDRKLTEVNDQLLTFVFFGIFVKESGARTNQAQSLFHSPMGETDA